MCGGGVSCDFACSDWNVNMLLPYPEGNKWGFVDGCGHWRVEPLYSNVDSFYEGMAIVDDEYGCKGGIDKDGAMVVPFDYKDLQRFEGGGGIGVRISDAMCGIVNLSGEFIGLERDSWGWNLGKGMFATYSHSKKGFRIVDVRGVQTNNLVYQDVLGMETHLIHCRREGEFRIEDMQGCVQRVFYVDRMENFFNGRAIACCEDLYGVIDLSGNPIVAMKFRDIQRIDDVMDRYVLVLLNNEDEDRFHLLDIKTGLISEWYVEDMFHVVAGHRNYYWALQNGVWSVMDEEFEVILSNVGFSANDTIMDGLVLVEGRNGWKYYRHEEGLIEVLF